MLGKQFENVHFAYGIRSFWWLLVSIPESRAHADHAAIWRQVLSFECQCFSDSQSAARKQGKQNRLAG